MARCICDFCGAEYYNYRDSGKEPHEHFRVCSDCYEPFLVAVCPWNFDWTEEGRG